jgi:predicted DNA-binding WGR domain protein
MGRVRRFEFVGGVSAKFWEVAQAGREVTVRFGRLDTNGQTQVKGLGSEEAAALHVDKLIHEKVAKGYVETTGMDTLNPPGRPVTAAGFTRPPALPPYEVPPVPADGAADIGGVRLPRGKRLEGDPDMAPPGIEMIEAPVVWLTEAPVNDAGAQFYQLRAPAADLGLVPILLVGMESEPARPWDERNSVRQTRDAQITSTLRRSSPTRGGIPLMRRTRRASCRWNRSDSSFPVWRRRR